MCTGATDVNGTILYVRTMGCDCEKQNDPVKMGHLVTMHSGITPSLEQ